MAAAVPDLAQECGRASLNVMCLGHAQLDGAACGSTRQMPVVALATSINKRCDCRLAEPMAESVLDGGAHCKWRAMAEPCWSCNEWQYRLQMAVTSSDGDVQTYSLTSVVFLVPVPGGPYRPLLHSKSIWMQFPLLHTMSIC